MSVGLPRRKMVSPASPTEWEAEKAVPTARLVKREQQLLTELKASFESFGAFFYKIPDMPHLGGATRFDTEKPFDAFSVFRKRRMAIEAKAISRYRAFALSDIRYSQEVGLTEFEAAGGESWVFLGIDVAEGDQRLLIFNWNWLIKRLRESSIKKKELEKIPYIARFNKRFDVSAWLKN